MARKKKEAKQAGRLDAALNQARKIRESEQPKKKQERQPVSFRLDPELVSRLRAAAYWTQENTGAIVTRALDREIDRLEKKAGAPFPRPGQGD